MGVNHSDLSFTDLDRATDSAFVATNTKDTCAYLS